MKTLSLPALTEEQQQLAQRIRQVPGMIMRFRCHGGEVLLSSVPGYERNMEMQSPTIGNALFFTHLHL